MLTYEAVIGVEVHAQLITASKMFCGCRADCVASAPNIHVCPVCLGMPGALPTINRAAVTATVRTGLALGCRIPAFAKFDRKNYPYPDLPKGYQISQYDAPLCVDGRLAIGSDDDSRIVRIRRVHLEEDTARLVHADAFSLIDYNRAGMPLMEIVTEADLRSADEVYGYLAGLRSILRYLGVSTANMEDGAMRCEINISVRAAGSAQMGTKVEVKNLNSLRSARLAVAFEVERQSALLERGLHVEQVTMGWDDERRCTVFQRSKESSEDYRYFPEPDLPPLELDRAWVDALRDTLPELPDARRQRFVRELHIRQADAALLAHDRAVAEYFEAAVAAARSILDPQVVANWILVELLRHASEAGVGLDRVPVRPEALVSLLGLVQKGDISQASGKDVLAEMVVSGESADQIVRRRGLGQISDLSTLSDIVARVVSENPGPVAQYRDGKSSVRAFLLGQIMRLTQGRANPQLAGRLLDQEVFRRAT